MAYNKTIASLVAQEFIQKKQKREALIAERRAVLLKEIPDLAAIENEISSISFSLFKKAADGLDAKKAGDEIFEKTKALTKKRDELITAAGYDSNYLNPPYDCPLCKDEGFLDNAYCNCFSKKLIALTLEESNLASLSENTFDSFSFKWYSKEKGEEGKSPYENMELIFADMKKYAENFSTTDDNILLTGPSGLGKTFLSSCVANHLIKEGVDVFYQSAGAVFTLLDKIKFGKSTTNEDLYTESKLLSSDLLILDDLGTEFITEFSVSELFRILNTRILSGKKTIISTNLSLTDIKRIYSERILSRILGSFVIHKFYGKDIRMLKKM